MSTSSKLNQLLYFFSQLCQNFFSVFDGCFHSRRPLLLLFLYNNTDNRDQWFIRTNVTSATIASGQEYGSRSQNLLFSFLLCATNCTLTQDGLSSIAKCSGRPRSPQQQSLNMPCSSTASLFLPYIPKPLSPSSTLSLPSARWLSSSYFCKPQNFLHFSDGGKYCQVPANLWQPHKVFKSRDIQRWLNQNSFGLIFLQKLFKF